MNLKFALAIIGTAVLATSSVAGAQTSTDYPSPPILSRPKVPGEDATLRVAMTTPVSALERPVTIIPLAPPSDEPILKEQPTLAVTAEWYPTDPRPV